MIQHYSNSTSSKASLFAGIFIAVVGLFMMFASVAVGFLFLLIAVGVYFGIRYFASNTTVLFRPDGFTVKVNNKRKGNSETDYDWGDVTDTFYYEASNGDDGSISKFRVMTNKGIAFDVYKAKGFHEMIALFNELTPHLPYYWNKTGKLLKPYEQKMRA